MKFCTSLIICLSGIACAAERRAQIEERPILTLVLSGDAAPLARIRAALAEDKRLPIEVRFADLPHVPPAEVPAGELESQLAAARRDYVRADFPACLKNLSDESFVSDLLRDGRRDLAARFLFWRLACHVGRGASADAQRDASALAVFELEPPPDVGAASPEVEAALAVALHDVSKKARTRVDVEVDVARGALSIDGRREVCITPCTVELFPGNHLLRIDADGVVPEVRSLRVYGEPIRTSIKTSAAPPELAAVQWTKRYAMSAEIDAPDSVRLLARAVRARRLALVTATSNSAGAGILRGALSIDGSATGRAERAVQGFAEIRDAAPDLLRDLLVSGRVLEPAPSLIERPLFWVTVLTTAALAAGGTVLLLYKPAPRAEVGF